MKKAVILLSGGLDSATCLAMARAKSFECYALSVDYGQRHRVELQAARRVADKLGVIEHNVIQMDLRAIGGSSLTSDLAVPQDRQTDQIPNTYVPARNTVMLGLALGWAEVLNATDIFIGVNAVDYSGYPDCRPAFIQSFEQLANLATKAGVEGESFTIHTPLIDLTKSEIVQQGTALGLDYGMTVSCYNADEKGRACGQCDSCYYRAQGFKDAGLPDPTLYR